MAMDQGAEAHFYVKSTTGLGQGAGDIMAIDNSVKGTTEFQADVFDSESTADRQLLGVAQTGTFDADGRIEDASDYPTGIVDRGIAHPRIRNDNAVIQAGDPMMAVADTQALSHRNEILTALAGQKVGATMKGAITNVATDMTGANCTLLIKELGMHIGFAMEDEAVYTDFASAKRDQRRIKTLLRLRDYWTVGVT